MRRQVRSLRQMDCHLLHLSLSLKRRFPKDDGSRNVVGGSLPLITTETAVRDPGLARFVIDVVRCDNVILVVRRLVLRKIGRSRAGFKKSEDQLQGRLNRRDIVINQAFL